MISFSSVAGIGSAGEVLMVISLIMFLISCCEAGWKTCSSEICSGFAVEMVGWVLGLWGSDMMVSLV